MTTFLTLTALLLATALQARLPDLPFGLRLELLPALVAYGSLTFRRTGALGLALAAGFLQDALSTGPFGLTGIAYGIVATVIQSFREALDRELPPLQMAAGAVVALVAASLMSAFAGFQPGKIFALTVLSAVLTPLLFFGLDYARHQLRPT